MVIDKALKRLENLEIHICDRKLDVLAIETLIQTYKEQAALLDLITDTLTTDIHKKEWIMDYFKKELVKKKQGRNDF